MKLNGTRYVCLLLLLLGCGGAVRAQDFHLTHYDAAKIYLNPAMTGMFDGHYRIHANYRTQWRSIASKPFTTGAAAFDMPIKRFGIGGQIMNNRAGLGNYNVLNIIVSGAYDLRIDRANNHHVAMGISAGVMQKSIDPSQLTWDVQYSNAAGGVFDNSLPSNETFQREATWIPDAHAGALYYFAKENARINPFLGISAFHVNRPTESFFGYNNKLPVRWVTHLGGRINLTETWQLQPRLLRMWQINDRETVIGLLGSYYLKASDAFLLFGPTFRLSGPMFSKNKQLALGPLEDDAFALEAGLKMGSFTYRISYDYNMSTLQPVSNGRGGLELSVIYIARKKQPVVAPNCPRL